MKTIYLSLVILICSAINAFAQTRNTAKLYADLAADSIKQDTRYYIIFTNNAPESESSAGHASVMWAQSNPNTLRYEMKSYSYWPDKPNITQKDNDTPGKIMTDSIPTLLELSALTAPNRLVMTSKNVANASLSTLPPLLKEDIAGAPYDTKQVVFEISKDIFDKTLQLRQTYSINSEMKENESLDFLISIGKYIGIDMPDKGKVSPPSWFPTAYLDLFIQKMSFGNGISLNNGAGAVFANTLGYYQVDFGGGNKNIGAMDVDKNITETITRNGKQVCQEINYSNGNRFYSEAKPRQVKINDVKSPDGSFVVVPAPAPVISNLYLANGGILYNYYPAKPQWDDVFIRLSVEKGITTIYKGQVTKDFVPDGQGTLYKYGEVDPANKVWLSEQYGIFSNGTFVHSSIRHTDIGTVFGDYKNGTPADSVRIEYKDGRIFVGYFKNNAANGKGFVSFQNGSSYTGNFKDGTFSGEGVAEIKGRNDATTRQLEGTWLNGKLTKGKIKYADGSYFDGTFDENGNVTGGNTVATNGQPAVNPPADNLNNYSFDDANTGGSATALVFTGPQSNAVQQ